MSTPTISRPAGGTRPEVEEDAGAHEPIVVLDARAALSSLGSSRRGLSGSEAARRRKETGPNALPPAPRRSVLAELGAQLTNMFAILLVIASALTTASYLLSTSRDPAELELAVAILGVVVLNALIGFAQEHSAERTAEALQALIPRTARVVRDGELTAVPAEELVPGDLVVLEPGDVVSADCRLIEANALAVEMATLTGESQPVSRVTEAMAPGTGLLDARNCVYMGTAVVSGTARALVFATGLSTEFGRIYRLTAGMPPEQSPLQRQVSDMAKRVGAIAIAAGALLFALRLVSGSAFVLSFLFALGVMVALVPEGLPATLSVSLAIGVRRMARRQALVKRLAAVEALGSTTVICTDKTGTLTKAEMTVQEIVRDGRVHAVSGVGYEPSGQVEDAPALEGLLRAAALCCDARLVPPTGGEGWRVLGDTTEGAILVAARKAGVAPSGSEAAARRATFPFDPDRKLMTTVYPAPDGLVAYVKGSPQAVLERCRAVRREHGEAALDLEARREIERANDDMARRALRVLAVATRRLPARRYRAEEVEEDLVFEGLIAMADPPRPEVAAAVATCHRAGIRILMVTGDYGLTAEAVARRVGIVGPGPARVVTGGELDGLDEEALSALLAGREQLIFARVRPEHKLRVVTTLERSGEIVAVTGDGANDAPALKAASIGVAMGEGGTDVARAAAVMVLLDDSFASIGVAIELGRAVYQNIRRFLVYLFSHNLAELTPILVAAFVGFPLVPLSALQVLAIDLGSDVMPALALGAERPEPGVMARPPRPARERLFSADLVRRFCFLGAIQSAGVVTAFFWRVHSAHLPFDAFTYDTATYREALTMTQAGIVVSQFFNSFAVRTDRESLLRVGILSNVPLLLAGFVAIGLMAAVSYAPPLEALFHTAPLRWSDWTVLVGFGALLLVADEIRKWALRRRVPRAEEE